MYDLIKAQINQLKSDERNGAALSPIDFELIDLYEFSSERIRDLEEQIGYLKGDIINLKGKSSVSKNLTVLVDSTFRYKVNRTIMESSFESNNHVMTIFSETVPLIKNDKQEHTILLERNRKPEILFTGYMTNESTQEKRIFKSNKPPEYFDKEK